MNARPILLLALLLTGCGKVASPSQVEPFPLDQPQHDIRAEFLELAAGDAWAKWPDGLQENPADAGQPCRRVSEQARDEAIARLSDEPAVAIDARDYEHLTGEAWPSTEGTLYLLRGFSTTNSASRVKVTGNAVTVHSDALGRLFNLRRHPCVAVLRRAPSAVYTVAAYDL